MNNDKDATTIIFINHRKHINIRIFTVLDPNINVHKLFITALDKKSTHTGKAFKKIKIWEYVYFIAHQGEDSSHFIAILYRKFDDGAKMLNENKHNLKGLYSYFTNIRTTITDGFVDGTKNLSREEVALPNTIVVGMVSQTIIITSFDITFLNNNDMYVAGSCEYNIISNRVKIQQSGLETEACLQILI